MVPLPANSVSHSTASTCPRGGWGTHGGAWRTQGWAIDSAHGQQGERTERIRRQPRLKGRWGCRHHKCSIEVRRYGTRQIHGFKGARRAVLEQQCCRALSGERDGGWWCKVVTIVSKAPLSCRYTKLLSPLLHVLMIFLFYLLRSFLLSRPLFLWCCSKAERIEALVSYHCHFTRRLLCLIPVATTITILPFPCSQTAAATRAAYAAALTALATSSATTSKSRARSLAKGRGIPSRLTTGLPLGATGEGVGGECEGLEYDVHQGQLDTKETRAPH